MVVLVVVVCSCARRWMKDVSHLPRPIIVRYEYFVNKAEQVTGKTWYYGWFGNMLQNTCLDRTRNKGKCFQWANYVYDKMRSYVKEFGYDIRKITYYSWTAEHHSNLVFRKTGRTYTIHDFLEGKVSGWVFDPWMYGQAHIFDVREWVRNPFILRDTIRFEYSY